MIMLKKKYQISLYCDLVPVYQFSGKYSKKKRLNGNIVYFFERAPYMNYLIYTTLQYTRRLLVLNACHFDFRE